MRVTLLGHASVVVEMDGATCVMDPVFFDPFEDTAVVSCPRRVVHLDKLPAIDVVILSHRHLDHFDIASLAKLPRDAQVLCPKDHVIVYALERLGFTKVNDAAPMTHLKVGSHEFLTTHSNVTNVIEFGVVFKDRSGTFWNQVDTVVGTKTLSSVLATAGRIDLLFAMYASQNFEFFESRATEFPYAMHERNLANVVAIGPRMAVPGAAGFRFAGDGVDWCNAFLFPMSRERFATDLARIAPAIESRIANPGDVFEVAGGEVRHLPAASPFATTLEDDTALLRFDPTAAIPPLRDPNPNGYSSERLASAVDSCIDGFTRVLRDAFDAGDPLIDAYRKVGVVYAIGVVFPDAKERWYRFDLRGAEPSVQAGEAAEAPSDAVHRIVASALTSWLAHDKSYFYLRAFSRRSNMVYTVSSDGGRVAVVPHELRDLLGYYLERKAPGAERALKDWLDMQLKPFVKVRD